MTALMDIHDSAKVLTSCIPASVETVISLLRGLDLYRYPKTSNNQYFPTSDNFT